MKPLMALLLLAFGAACASAHRLDEYLQATTISLEKDQVRAQIRMTPGVAVLPPILAAIDANGDGAISTGEQRAYAARVLGDLSLAVDGEHLQLRLVSLQFPALDAMREGLGEIRIDVAADLHGGGRERALVLENHHQRQFSVYLVNCLTPQDPDIRVAAQSRNYEQSLYRLDYSQAGGVRVGLACFGSVAIFLFARMAVLTTSSRRARKR